MLIIWKSYKNAYVLLGAEEPVTHLGAVGSFEHVKCVCRGTAVREARTVLLYIKIE